MKIARLNILNFVFFVLLVIVNNGDARESELKDGHWTKITKDTIVRYVVDGEIIPGHKFGFAKTAGNCSRDLLWISWTSYVEGTEEFQGIDATLQLQVDDIEFRIEIPVVAVIEAYPTAPSPTALAFSNFIAGEELIALMEKGKKVDVRIIGPKDFVSQFEIPKDSFPLDGFIDARLQSKKICEGL